jgi:hypothetical protein
MLVQVRSDSVFDRHDILQRGDDTLTVKPLPFADKEVTVCIDVGYPTQMKFESDRELVTALKSAPIKSIE